MGDFSAVVFLVRFFDMSLALLRLNYVGGHEVVLFYFEMGELSLCIE
jgi:hypothetical protein